MVCMKLELAGKREKKGRGVRSGKKKRAGRGPVI